MKPPLSSQTPSTGSILITGAAQGIGQAIARAVATPKRTLLLADTNIGGLTRIASELKPKCAELRIYAGDLTQPETRTYLVSDIFQRYDRMDVLINNAGVAPEFRYLEDYSEQEYNLVFDVNTKLPFQLMHDFLPKMKEHNSGLIINISSTANIWGYNSHSIYAASKAALTSMTESVAQEVENNFNIKALTILPSRTHTPMNIKLRGLEESEKVQSADLVGKVVADVIDLKIYTKNGDSVKINSAQVKVEQDMSKESPAI